MILLIMLLAQLLCLSTFVYFLKYVSLQYLLINVDFDPIYSLDYEIVLKAQEYYNNSMKVW